MADEWQKELDHLEERIARLNKKRRAMELDLDSAAKGNERATIEMQLDELSQQLRNVVTQQMNLLTGQAPTVITDDADETVAALGNALAESASEIEEQADDETRELLQQILDAVKDDSNGASAKLKVAIPIVPGLISWEMEKSATKPLNSWFERLKDRIRSKPDPR